MRGCQPTGNRDLNPTACGMSTRMSRKRPSPRVCREESRPAPWPESPEATLASDPQNHTRISVCYWLVFGSSGSHPVHIPGATATSSASEHQGVAVVAPGTPPGLLGTSPSGRGLWRPPMPPCGHTHRADSPPVCPCCAQESVLGLVPPSPPCKAAGRTEGDLHARP